MVMVMGSTQVLHRSGDWEGSARAYRRALAIRPEVDPHEDGEKEKQSRESSEKEKQSRER